MSVDTRGRHEEAFHSALRIPHSALPPSLGLDIGGANLKVAHTNGPARTIPFALWKEPEGLTRRLLDLFHQMPSFTHLAVTMTGELCDCYAHRQEGVQRILDSVEEAVRQKAISLDAVRVWQTTGRFASLNEAWENWRTTASANWLATATFAGRFVPEGNALFLDIGSTTTDLVPLYKGVPGPGGLDDHARLCDGTLLYAGVKRTPVPAVLSVANPENPGMLGPLIPELFATMQDAYVLLGDLPEDAADRDTADGQPLTRPHCINRLLRLLGLDLAMEPHDGPDLAHSLAEAAKADQLNHLVDRIQQLLPTRIGSDLKTKVPDVAAFILAGSGDFLARQALRVLLAEDDHLAGAQIISLADHLGPDRSTAAAAYAVAMLASEQNQ